MMFELSAALADRTKPTGDESTVMEAREASRLVMLIREGANRLATTARRLNLPAGTYVLRLELIELAPPEPPAPKRVPDEPEEILP